MILDDESREVITIIMKMGIAYSVLRLFITAAELAIGVEDGDE